MITMLPRHPSPRAAVLMRCVRVRGWGRSILLLPCYQPRAGAGCRAGNAVYCYKYQARDTTRNPGHRTIAPSHSDHTRQEAALITTICSAHSRPAEISIPHFVMMTQTYLKCLLLLHINTPNMTREENFEYRKYAARSSSAVIHSSHLQHCNERFIALHA